MSARMLEFASTLPQRVVRKARFIVRHHGPVFFPRLLVRLLRADARPIRRVALVVKGKTAHPPTAHIRVLRPFELLSRRIAVDVRPVDVSWLLAGGIDKVDAVLVQRDALPHAATDALIGKLRTAHVPLHYEIDDWLWNLPPDHGDHGVTHAHTVSMRTLARAATTASVSTTRLAEILRLEGCIADVIPNGLDETLWTSTLSADYVRKVGETNGLTAGRTRLFYMGTKSHAEDLKLIFSAVERLRARHPELEIIQVGGGSLLPGAREICPPPGEYPDFVRWFRAVCSYMTLAVAPLRDDEFNSAKSDIKTLDYGFGLVPGIYSNVGPYRASVVHGMTGLLCDNDTEAWYDAMSALLANAGLRSRILTHARTTAQQRGMSRQVVAKWEGILRKLFVQAPVRSTTPVHRAELDDPLLRSPHGLGGEDELLS